MQTSRRFCAIRVIAAPDETLPLKDLHQAFRWYHTRFDHRPDSFQDLHRALNEQFDIKSTVVDGEIAFQGISLINPGYDRFAIEIAKKGKKVL